ncbi:MAG TPA: DUF1566 domain-containing protein [Thermodesulfovibrionales bacterium]|nr:DUF1566 domain-containing protein [Thermodesulfovibrionales bacterium]
MKGKSVITVMVGLLFLSFLFSIAEAAPGGLPECTTNLAVCTTNLTNAQANLAVCQETVTQCIQKTSFSSWDKKFPCDSTTNCPRFEVLADWGNAAVLDNETGLVWEKSPSTSCYEKRTALSHCADLNVGGRKGWHLPTIDQLATLVDTSVAGSPKLPSGHPFIGVVSDGFYWSNSALVFFSDGSVLIDTTPGCTDGCCGTEHVWCVRGGQSAESTLSIY